MMPSIWQLYSSSIMPDTLATPTSESNNVQVVSGRWASRVMRGAKHIRSSWTSYRSPVAIAGSMSIIQIV